MGMTTIACVQMDVAIGEVEANRRKIVERTREAVEREAELVIFPECALTGYCFDSLAEAAQVAEPLAGPSAKIISEVCAETGAHVVVGFIERASEQCYNAAMIVGP